MAEKLILLVWDRDQKDFEPSQLRCKRFANRVKKVESFLGRATCAFAIDVRQFPNLLMCGYYRIQNFSNRIRIFILPALRWQFKRLDPFAVRKIFYKHSDRVVVKSVDLFKNPVPLKILGVFFMPEIFAKSKSGNSINSSPAPFVPRSIAWHKYTPNTENFSPTGKRYSPSLIST